MSENQRTETPEQRRDRLLAAARSLDGPLLPDGTSDDTDAGWSERSASDRDAEIARDKPPHH